MNKFTRILTLCAVAGAGIHLNAQSVTVDPTQLVNGYMSWTPVAGDAPGYGGSNPGGQGWGFSALQASYSGSTLTLSPNINAYADNVAAGNGSGAYDYWIQANGAGANVMDASSYAESTAGALGVAGGTLTFSFNVLANTLAPGYTADAWIKDFGPGFSSFNGESTPVALTPGVNSVSFNIANNPNDVVQYGFEVIGPDANPNVSEGSVEISPVPEPSSLALIGLGIGSVLRFRRSRSV